MYEFAHRLLRESFLIDGHNDVTGDSTHGSVRAVTPLEYAEDGSLTLYLASGLPDGVPEGNWLPSPKDQPFVVNTRLYVPKDEVVAGEYSPPPIQRVE